MYQNYTRLRDERNLSDYAVSQHTGIPRSTFTDWKSGRSAPKMEKLIKIADFLGVTVDELVREAT